MSSRDRLIEQLLKAKPDNATQRLIDQAMKAQPSSAVQQFIDSQMRAFNSISAVEAMARAASNNAQRIMEQMVTYQIRPQYLQAIENLMVPRIDQRFLEAIHKSIMFPAIDIQTQAVQALVNSVHTIKQSDVERIIDSLAKQTRVDYDRLGAVAGSAALAAFKSALPDMLDAISTRFAGVIANSLKQALDNRDEKAFAHVEQIIEDKLAKLPKNRVSAEGVWIIVLQILLQLLGLGLNTYQIYDAKQSSVTQTEQFTQIRNFLERIANNTEHHVPENDNNIYYVVERPVNLKVGIKSKSAIIATLFPNQKVRLVQMNHQWIYIEYFDYLEGIPKYGWASKKYLKRVGNKILLWQT